MDDSGAAYTFAMVIVLIFIAALTFAFLVPSMNVFTGQVNKQIVKGEISEQTKVVYEWNMNFFAWSLAIGLIGFTVFCIVRAIEVAEAGGGLY
jgi:TRAP-type C4-dicarboxylate transport system permease small subunit